MAVSTERYIKANVPITIYNQVYNAHYGEGDFYNLLYKRCFSYDNAGACSTEAYYNACMDYINDLKYKDGAYEKWIKDVSRTYCRPTWKQNIKEQFSCKSNKEFITLAKRIIETV